MKTPGIIALAGLLGVAALPAAEDLLDRVGEALTFSTPSGDARLRLSGIVDAEYYDVSLPTPGLLYTDEETLFYPRVSLFADAELGARMYFFAQVRVDQGFDPNDEGEWECRLDEFALRVTLGTKGRGSLQFGKFATIIGNWVPRHDSWENPFITAPVPYENLTGIWETMAARSINQILAWAHLRPPASPAAEYADKHLRLPIIWGPSYATGAAWFGRAGKFDAAIEVKNAALASQPDSWNYDGDQWDHPTVSGRLGWQPNAMWNLGVSGSSGSYLRPTAEPTVAPGHDRGDYRQVMVGQDIGFAWHHWQIWGEWFQTRFEIPEVGDAETFAWYVEAKYKFTPQLFGAVRWNDQHYGTLPDGRGGEIQWGRDLQRLDLSAGWRFTPHVQLKVQYSRQDEDRTVNAEGHTFATQFTVRF